MQVRKALSQDPLFLHTGAKQGQETVWRLNQARAAAAAAATTATAAAAAAAAASVPGWRRLPASPRPPVAAAAA